MQIKKKNEEMKTNSVEIIFNIKLYLVKQEKNVTVSADSLWKKKLARSWVGNEHFLRKALASFSSIKNSSLQKL